MLGAAGDGGVRVLLRQNSPVAPRTARPWVSPSPRAQNDTRKDPRLQRARWSHAEGGGGESYWLPPRKAPSSSPAAATGSRTQARGQSQEVGGGGSGRQQPAKVGTLGKKDSGESTRGCLYA